MKKLYLFFFILPFILRTQTGIAQMVGDNVFLPGQWIEAGIAPNGSMGSTRGVPSGYYSNAPSFTLYDPALGSSVTTSTALMMIYDHGHDGWTVSTPGVSPAFMGDYSLPGTPYEGWGVQINGTHSEAQFQYYTGGTTSGFSGGTLTGTNASYTNSGGHLIGVWTGTAASGALSITQTCTLDTSASWVNFNVKMVNTGSSTLTAVYYERELDPDNDETHTAGADGISCSGSFSTTNTIDYQNDYVHRVEVTAKATCITANTLSLATKDCRAKCYIHTGWPMSTSTSLASVYSSTGGFTYSGTVTGDDAIGIVWSLGNIAAGDSTELNFSYVYDNLNNIDSAVADPKIVTLGIAHDSLDTVAPCSYSGDTLNVTIANATTGNWYGSTWTWAPSTNLYATTGTTNMVIGTTATTTYTVTGTNSRYGMCESKTFLLTVLPPGTTPTPTVHDTSYCLGATAGPLTAVGSGLLWYTSSTGGTGSSTAPTPSTSTVGTFTWWVSQTIGGCLSGRVPINVHIVPLPGAITGSSTVCIGSTVTEADTSAGGHWSISPTTVATVGSSTGVVTGVASGTATLSYTVSSGCSQTKVITVNPLPSAIGGVMTVCAGATTTLSDVGSGTWSSSPTSIATVGSSTGVVTGVSAGVATITYTLATGCFVTANVTVNPAPAPISGPSGICLGSSVLETDATTGGVWSSTYPTIASVGSTTGVVTGLSTGTSTISYTQAGCSALKPVTVYPLPGAITGLPTVCVTQTTTLFDFGGGTWTSSNTSIATVGSSTGVVTGVAIGAVTITYTLPTGCYTTLAMTVEPLPGVITGSHNVCVGATTTLADTATGGFWSSSDATIAYIDPATGVVTGMSTGTAVISYSGASGCPATFTVTVSSAPSPITGSPVVCVGGTISLFNSTTGGTWSSSSGSIATIGSSSGILTGVSSGHSIIDYTMPSGCFAAVIATVNPLPVPISGTATVCIGFTSTLTDGSPGGSWTSSNPGIASIVSTTGVMTGVSAGTATITYTLPTGCSTTYPVTVNTSPGAISGPNHLCVGATIALSDAVTGGTWSSSTTTVATVGSITGIVTGMTAGIATITYSVGIGCHSTLPITVNPLPAAITGPPAVCVGASITLADGTAGGTWSSTSTAVTVGSSTGSVTGVNAGIAVISYTAPTGCIRTTTVNVNPRPTAFSVTGGGAYCAGGTGVHIGLSGSSVGVTYQLYNGATLVGPAVSGTGLAIDFGLQTAAGTYTVVGTTTATSCTGAMTGSVTISINPLPPLCTVTGGGGICAGGPGIHVGLSCSSLGISYQLMLGGTPVGAPLPGTGGALDFGLQTTAGTYTVVATNTTTGCSRTMTGSAVITINPPPSPIGGPSAVCVGASIVLTSAPGGGVWSVGTPSVATINPSSGVLTGSSIGTTSVTYTLSTGCIAVGSVTVSVSPTAITGPAGVCVGASDTLFDLVAGGVWTSSAPSIASIGSLTGVVTGISVGTATITYSLGTGCTRTHTITVGPAPAPISGPSFVCMGSTISLSDATPGGSWSSGAISTASVSGTGVVTGVTAGTAIISYTAAGCPATKSVTVNPLPGPIGGPSSVCVASSITLTDATPGGAWSSASSTVSVGSASGIVTGVSAGTATITYSIGACQVTTTITVNTTAPITGALGICVGATTALSDAIAGGTWSSGTPSVATIGASTGIVTGVTPGTSLITYVIPGGCSVVATVTVNLAPTAIAGPLSLCAGTSATLTDAAGGGVWTSSSPSVAAVGSSSGIVTAIATGTSNITYSLGSICAVHATVTVNPLPAAITGTTSACAGSSTVLTDATAGGTWSIGGAYSGIASVGASTGLVTGASAGVAVVTYTLPTGCTRTIPVTINPVPATPGGPASVCQGLTTTLTDATPGGVWTSATPSVATVAGGTGVVTGITPGTSLITYSIGGCSNLITVTVTPAPSVITGPSSVCVGNTITLSDAVPGGIWSSSIPAMATISSSGIVTGVASGTVIISYTIGTGCFKAMAVAVNPVSAIYGTPVVCVGQTTHLFDTTLGGSWSTSAPGIAIVSASGIVTGLSAGTCLIDYTLPSGCVASIMVTVNPAPLPISGLFSLCVGQTDLFSDLSPGGNWGSSASAIASVDPVGNVTAVSPGIATISYTLAGTTGCAATATVTVHPLPTPVSGPNAVCIGDHITMTDAVSGGMWSSSSPAIGSVDATTGVVAGLSAGATTITYSLSSTSCFVTKPVSVMAAPPAPTGSPLVICQGQTTTLTDVAGPGFWSSSNPSIAMVGSTTGVVTGGVYAGTAGISFAVLTGCWSSPVFVTVNPLPGAVTGPSVLCVGQTAAFTDSYTGGGSWSSSDTTVAGISAGGLVTAVSPGTTIIAFTTAAGCTATASLTVDSSPLPIVGASAVCVGSTITLSDATTGGSWSSSTPAVASVDVAGNVTGATIGTTTISYSIGTTCPATKVVTVTPFPSAIVGASMVCAGQTTTLTNAVPGGIWTSSDITTATVGSSSGVVTGVVPGTVTIGYSLGTGCSVSQDMTVNSLPSPISGPNNVCQFQAITLSDATPFGSWSSSNPAVGSVDAFGDVTGVTGGIVSISYTNAFGCSVAYPVTVNTSPTAITGATNVCVGGTSILHDAVAGGVWTSYGTAVATVGSTTGVVTGVSVGAATIVYNLPGNCFVSTVVNVYPRPVAFNVSGGGSHCAGDTGVHIMLSGSQAGVNYMVYNGATAVGTFPGSGLAMDLGRFTVAGTYTVVGTSTLTGCSINMTGSAIITISPSYVPSVTMNISPNDTVCAGTSVTFTPVPVNGGTSPAYLWSVNSTPVAVTSSYTFIPANGDVVSVVLTSNLHCAIPATASSSVTMTVLPFENPSVSISATPGDTVCKGSAVTLSALPEFGGASPVYSWLRNSAPSGTGATYTFIPNDGDVVQTVINSNYPCRLSNNDTSSPLVIHADTARYPLVTITGSPGTSISLGQPDTLTATVANAELPTYQWYVNGLPVPAATNSVYVGTSFSYPHEDSVSVAVTNHGICSITSHQWVYIRVHPVGVQQITAAGVDISVLPNPNKGDFMIRGTLGTTMDQEVSLEVTDMIGQVVYKDKVTAKNGKLDEHVQLRKDLANGMYVLTIHADADSRVFHIVVEQ